MSAARPHIPALDVEDYFHMEAFAGVVDTAEHERPIFFDVYSV